MKKKSISKSDECSDKNEQDDGGSRASQRSLSKDLDEEEEACRKSRPSAKQGKWETPGIRSPDRNELGAFGARKAIVDGAQRRRGGRNRMRMERPGGSQVWLGLAGPWKDLGCSVQ